MEQGHSQSKAAAKRVPDFLWPLVPIFCTPWLLWGAELGVQLHSQWASIHGDPLLTHLTLVLMEDTTDSWGSQWQRGHRWPHVEASEMWYFQNTRKLDFLSVHHQCGALWSEADPPPAWTKFQTVCLCGFPRRAPADSPFLHWPINSMWTRTRWETEKGNCFDVSKHKEKENSVKLHGARGLEQSSSKWSRKGTERKMAHPYKAFRHCDMLLGIQEAMFTCRTVCTPRKEPRGSSLTSGQPTEPLSKT
jgi:hypothetical protein